MKNDSKYQAGVDYIGVGVGALIFNSQSQLLLTKRGSAAKNEVGKWEIPGGQVEFNETLQQALKREIKEELGIKIEIIRLLHVVNHIIPQEKQHWVSPTFICRIKTGTPQILEPKKCEKIDWFNLEEVNHLDLSIATKKDINYLKANPELITN
ncbi:MAG: NUDIX domain-containing protein [Patescibacteria group bacterium]|nr:NUDIX domain-containing protein [Patescibacteria group bacterium]